MKKWTLGLILLIFSVVFVRAEVASALNTTTSRLQYIPPAQYTQITSMSGKLQKVTQTGEVVVAITLMGQGSISNINVDYRNVPTDYQTHFHTHLFLDSGNIVVGREETYRLRRTENSFPSSGTQKRADITATGRATMQGGNWPLATTHQWTPGAGFWGGGLRPPRSLPTPLNF